MRLPLTTSISAIPLWLGRGLIRRLSCSHHGEEARALALTEQTGSAVGMDELRVTAPGTGDSQARVEVDPANRGESGLHHGALTVGRRCHIDIGSLGWFLIQTKDLSCLGHSARYPPR